MKRLFATILFGFILSSSAHAGLLLEPYANYGFGKWTQGTSNQSLDGVSFGGRIGYESFFGLMLGLDYQLGNWKDDASPQNTIGAKDAGVFVGVDFPILLRLYAEYAVSRRDFSSSTASDTYFGHSTKFGLSFKPIPFISVNFEYLLATLTRDSAGTMTGGDMKNSMLQLGVSIPLNLF